MPDELTATTHSPSSLVDDGDDYPPGESAEQQTAKPKKSLFSGARRLIYKIFPRNSTLEDSVVELIEEHHDTEGKSVTNEERTLLHNLLGFSELKVDDVMVPRTDIIAIEYGISLDDIKKIVIDKEHTRMPVYKDSLDNIVGFIHIKDLISYINSDKAFIFDEIIREILFVPPSMKIIDLLARMRTAQTHMALVLDEYGGTDGLVTIEDLMEEIVGEIEDEHDEKEEPEIKSIDANTYEASARMDIEVLEETLGVSLIDKENGDDFDTLGGLIFSLLGYVPEVNETVEHPSGITMQILEADARRINLVRIHRQLPDSNPED